MLYVLYFSYHILHYILKSLGFNGVWSLINITLLVYMALLNYYFPALQILYSEKTPLTAYE